MAKEIACAMGWNREQRLEFYDELSLLPKGYVKEALAALLSASSPSRQTDKSLSADEPEIRPIDATRFKTEIAAMALTMGYDNSKAVALCSLVDAQPTISAVPQRGAIEPEFTDTAKLDRCKFCGAKAEIHGTDEGGFADDRIYRYGHYVACRVCGCRTPAYKDINNAILAWNRNPEPWP